MSETIVVYVNDKPVEIYRGMKVKHALISCGNELYKAAAAGDLSVRDESGFEVGLNGSLSPGARIYILPKRP
jgi:hypothetical protein